MGKKRARMLTQAARPEIFCGELLYWTDAAATGAVAVCAPAQRCPWRLAPFREVEVFFPVLRRVVTLGAAEVVPAAGAPAAGTSLTDAVGATCSEGAGTFFDSLSVLSTASPSVAGSSSVVACDDLPLGVWTLTNQGLMKGWTGEAGRAGVAGIAGLDVGGAG